jgi:hypothetical protein
MVHLIQVNSADRNERTILFQYIIVPPSHAREGRHVGTYPDVASAYHAAIRKGAALVYLHADTDFPFKMRDANDTRGMAWCEQSK